MIDIKDKNGLVIEVGQIVKMKGQDCEDGVVCGFDGDRVDVLELGDGFTIDSNDIEVVGELNG